MAEIDLIPADYRSRIWLQGKALNIGVAVALAVVVLLLALGVLHYQAIRTGRLIAGLQARQAVSAQQRERFTQLDRKRAELESRLVLLRGLRGGAVASAMFEAVDRAMVEGDVWFLSWDFNRAGSVVEHRPETASNGYFIVIPATDGKQSNEAWKIETRMQIHGQAKDYSALSEFVRRMYRQPEIQDVRIINTTLVDRTQFVDFNLAVTVNTHETKD
jgi:hypothetical protein